MKSQPLRLTIEEIAQATGGIAAAIADLGLQVTGIATDSRTVKPGQAFFALPGPRYDGHEFIDQAFKAGARVAVTTRPTAHPAIIVPGAVEALGDLAYHWRRKFSCRVIAVTGSNGKTTTKNLIARVIAEHYRVLKTEENFNNLIGLPLTTLKLRHHHQVGVFELGMSVRGEIGRLAEICSPEIGVVTNIGPAHIAGLGTVAEIAEAKFELLGRLPSGGWAVLNHDNPFTRSAIEKTRAEVLTFGLASGADVRARSIRTGPSGTVFTVGSGSFRIPLLGRHNVSNALAAICCGRLLGVSEPAIRRALRTAEPEKLRTQIVKKSGLVIINDTYNANPESVRAALATLGLFKRNRKIAVLGGMLELGEDSDRLHRLVAHAATRAADFVVFVGGEAEAYDDGARNTRFFKGKGAALRFLKGYVRPGDVILVKGSRATAMEEIIKRLGRD